MTDDVLKFLLSTVNAAVRNGKANDPITIALIDRIIEQNTVKRIDEIAEKYQYYDALHYINQLSFGCDC